MTDKQVKQTHDNASGAYVLNALDEQERTDFEAQLASSQDLRNEVTELTDTAVLLGMAVAPVTPSAELRESIMSRLSSTPQLSRDVAPVRTLRAVPALAADDTTDDSTGRRGVETDIQPPVELSGKARVRWFNRPFAAVTAAAAAVLLVAGAAFGANAALTGIGQQKQADALAAIYSAPDVQRAAATVTSGGKATLVWSLDLHKSALIVNNLASLPTNKTYELWYINSKGVPSRAGLFDSNGKRTWEVLDGTMSKGDTVGVTVEPSGGSDSPTTAPIVAIPSA